MSAELPARCTVPHVPQSPGRQRDRPWPAPTHLQMPVMLRLVAAASTRDQLVCAMKCGPNTAESFFQEKLLKRNQKSLFLCEICQFKKCWLKCLKCGKCRECKLCSRWKTVRGFPQKTKIKTTKRPAVPLLGTGPQEAASPSPLCGPRSPQRALSGRGVEVTRVHRWQSGQEPVLYRRNGRALGHRRGRKPCRVQRHRWTSRAACQVT